MGIHYGEEAGDLIRWVFDAWWITGEEIISNFGKSHVVEDLIPLKQFGDEWSNEARAAFLDLDVDD